MNLVKNNTRKSWNTYKGVVSVVCIPNAKTLASVPKRPYKKGQLSEVSLR